MKEKQITGTKKTWTFLRMFRWTIYLFFAALILFTSVCVATGIISNISERYPELLVLDKSTQQLGDLTSDQLRDCRDALARMRQEDIEQTIKTFFGEYSRDEFLLRYRKWSDDWRKRFEKLGISCSLTSELQSTDPIQQRLALVYQKVDELHRYHSRLSKKYTTENALRLKQIRELMKQTKELEGMPQEKSHRS